jgi:Methylamine dehydrogenase heavy chain (MADH)
MKSHWLLKQSNRTFRPFAALGPVRLYSVASLVVALLAPCQFLSVAQQPTSGPGKLYVLDSNSAQSTSTAFVVDLEKGQVTKTYPAGFHPDIVLSPGGHRLYLAYDVVKPDQTNEKGVLDVIDTATGNLIAQVDNPNRWMAIGELYDSTMTISKDGRWLFVYKTSTEGTFCGLAVFDTAANRFLPDTIALPKCEAALLIPSPRSGNTLFVVCEGTNDVRTARLTPNGKPVVNEIPSGLRFARKGMVETAFQSDDDLLRVVMREGEYTNLDLATNSIVGRGALVGTRAKRDSGDEGNRLVRFSQSAAGQAFLGLVGLKHRNRLLFDEIAVVKARTLEETATLQSSAPLWAFAVGDGGNRLYGLDPRGGNIHVFDTTQASETEIIRGIGKSPTIAILSQ